MALFIPCHKKIIATKLITQFLNGIVYQYGLLDSIVLDPASFLFFSEADKKTALNYQTLEQYLQAYINY